MLRFFGSLSLLWKVGIIVGLLAGAVGAFKLWEHSIYQRGYDEATAACQKRADKQEEVIEQVKADAEREQDRLEFTITMLRRENDNAIEDIDAATAADPDGDDICISADGVQRLNAIR